MDDGIAMVSAAHPPDPWPWYPPLSGFNHLNDDLDPFSLETIEIDLHTQMVGNRPIAAYIDKGCDGSDCDCGGSVE